MKNLINFIKKHKKLTVLIIIILLMIINTIKNNPWLIPTPLLTKKQLFRFQMIYEAEHNSVSDSYKPIISLNGTYNYELLKKSENGMYVTESKNYNNQMYFKDVKLMGYYEHKNNDIYADVINLKDKKHYRIDLKKKVLEGVDTKDEVSTLYPFKKQGIYFGYGGTYIDETNNSYVYNLESTYNLEYNEKYDFYCWKVKFTEDFSINFYRILLNDGTRIYYSYKDKEKAEEIFGKK